MGEGKAMMPIHLSTYAHLYIYICKGEKGKVKEDQTTLLCARKLS